MIPLNSQQYTCTYHVSNSFPTHIHISTISTIQHPKTPHCEDVDERHRWKLVRGEHGSWEMLREGRDIIDVTLVFGHEDRQGDKKISP